MTSRPEILFPLHRSLTTLEGIGPGIEKKMKGLLIDKPVDLLFTLPISFIKRKPPLTKSKRLRVLKRALVF